MEYVWVLFQHHYVGYEEIDFVGVYGEPPVAIAAMAAVVAPEEWFCARDGSWLRLDPHYQWIDWSLERQEVVTALEPVPGRAEHWDDEICSKCGMPYGEHSVEGEEGWRVVLCPEEGVCPECHQPYADHDIANGKDAGDVLLCPRRR
jgi:hypothetical protein